jgi:3-oxoacid CoA-transferase subunit A
MIYITGDTHRDFKRTAAFCDAVQSKKDDILIISGDAGINYFGGEKDRALKRQLAEFPITMFCVHGNHEQRPETLGYLETAWNGGTVYCEPEYPNLLFAKDGEIYDFDGNRCIAIGGAYSVDKPWRLQKNWGWFPDEQPSAEIKKRVENRLNMEGWRVDVVLSHTCPIKYLPREMFIGSVNQTTVDSSTEEWLDAIEDRLEYKKWYCGHHHVDKTVDRLRFMFEDFLELKEVTP